MKLRKNSWHAGIYRFFKNSSLPKNYCDYLEFWFLFLVVLFAILGLLAISFYGIYTHPLAALYSFLTVVSILCLPYFFISLMERIIVNITHYIEKIKEKYCPIIIWKD